MATTTEQTARKNAPAVLLEELSAPEVQQALVTLIHKLPQLTQTVEKMEQGVGLVSSVVGDMDTINKVAEPVNHIAKIALNQETLEALGKLFDRLPQITQFMDKLDSLIPLLEFMSKRETWVSVAEIAELVSEPVIQRAQEGMDMVKEAQRRAEQNAAGISIFGLLRLLKDPAVQDGLKFVQAFLEILQERRGVRH